MLLKLVPSPPFQMLLSYCMAEIRKMFNGLKWPTHTSCSLCRFQCIVKDSIPIFKLSMDRKESKGNLVSYIADTHPNEYDENMNFSFLVSPMSVTRYPSFRDLSGLWYRAPMTLARLFSSTDSAEAWSEFIVVIFIGTCWMLDLTNTAMPPKIKFEPLVL